MTFDELKNQYGQVLHFFRGNDLAVDFAWSLIAGHFYRLPDPLWGFLLGAPSWGKSLLLQTLKTWQPHVHICDMVSAQALSSGYRSEEDPQNDPSLLGQLDNKIFLMEDLTVQFDSQPKDALRKFLALMRQTYAGKILSHFGNIGQVGYDCRLTWMGSCTDSMYEKMHEQQALGPRLVFFHVEAPHGFDETREVAAAIAAIPDRPLRMTALEKAVHSYGNQVAAHLGGQNKPPLPEAPDHAALFGLVYALARFRSYPLSTSTVEPEGPGRLQSQLTSLGHMRTLLDGRTAWGPIEYALVRRAALGSIAPYVRRILQHLWRSGGAPGQGGTCLDSCLAPELGTDVTIMSKHLRQWRDSDVFEIRGAAHWFSAPLADTIKRWHLFDPTTPDGWTPA